MYLIVEGSHERGPGSGMRRNHVASMVFAGRLTVEALQRMGSLAGLIALKERPGSSGS
jgi:hypothetical protein